MGLDFVFSLQGQVGEEALPTGFVYLLTSPATQLVKIGGTEFPPTRLRQINSSEPYASLGPWGIADFRKVKDWPEVEKILHQQFADKRVRHIDGAHELFNIRAPDARRRFEMIDNTYLVNVESLDAMFVDTDFRRYLVRLMQASGLLSRLEDQGRWTLTLYPSTNGGHRYFTLNIGTHEVAFSVGAKDSDSAKGHVFVMDELVRDIAEVARWLKSQKGEIRPAPYRSAIGRAVSVEFDADFATAETFFSLSGVIRALKAYWIDALDRLTERQALSVHSRHHNYNAVAMLWSKARAFQFDRGWNASQPADL